MWLGVLGPLEVRDGQRVAAALTSDVRDHWDEREWRFVSQSARYHGRSAIAVFAAPLARYQPEAIPVAVIDDTTGVTAFAVRSTVDVPTVAYAV